VTELTICPSYPGPPLRSHGADRFHGPPCCQGHPKECNGYPAGKCGDHCCCCDPCQHSVWNHFAQGCPAACCACVPKSLCAVFTPDTETDECIPLGIRMDAEHTAEGGTSYGGYLPGLGSFTVSVELLYQQCVWRLRVPDLDIDESYPIDHFGEINCRQPPVFVIEGVEFPTKCETCSGTVEILPYEGMTKLPFLSRTDLNPATETVPVECGACSEVCSVLCLKRLNPDEPDDPRDTLLRTEFRWDESYGSWLSVPSGSRINLVEYGGQCYLQFFTTDPALEWLEYEEIPIGPYNCGVGMWLRIENPYTGEWVELSCNPCDLWRYVCGACRCICKDVCMVGMQDGEPILHRSLGWNMDDFQWEGEYGDVIAVRAVDPPRNNNCEARMEGFDPVAISNTCGTDLVFTFAKQEGEHYNWRTIYCKDCAPCAGGGDCLSSCPVLPKVLYADFTHVEWQVGLCGPAEGPAPPGDPCFEPFTIPLFLIRAAEGSAAEWLWYGAKYIQCRDCFGGLTGYNGFLVTLAVLCDGTIVGTFGDFSFVIPCGCEYGVWNIQLETIDGFTVDAKFCCTSAKVSIVIME
jgi:hypothetical protein